MADYIYTIRRAKADRDSKLKRYTLFCHQSNKLLSYKYSNPLWSIASVQTRADRANDHHVIRIIDPAGNLIYEETVGWARDNKLVEVEIGQREYAYPCFVDMSLKNGGKG